MAFTKEELKEAKAKCKELYFRGFTPTQMTDVTKVKLATVKSWIYGQNSKGGWKIERQMTQNQLLKDLTADKRQMVGAMVNGCMFLIYDYVEDCKKKAILESKPIDIRTAEKLTAILGNLHKIAENERDRSTEDGNFVKPADPKEMQKRVMKADPFAAKQDVIEVKVENKKASKSVKIHKAMEEEMVKSKEDSNEEIKNKNDIASSPDSDEWFS